jgi:heme O synthase-like polyprenyltransferase
MISRSNSPVAAIAVISLFTLSAAVMGYIFCYQPAQLYFDNKKKQAIKLFIQTVIAFAVMTSLVFILLFFGIF